MICGWCRYADKCACDSSTATCTVQYHWPLTVLWSDKKLWLHLGYRWDICDEEDHPSSCQDLTRSTTVDWTWQYWCKERLGSCQRLRWGVLVLCNWWLISNSLSGELFYQAVFLSTYEETVLVRWNWTGKGRSTRLLSAGTSCDWQCFVKWTSSAEVHTAVIHCSC